MGRSVNYKASLSFQMSDEMLDWIRSQVNGSNSMGGVVREIVQLAMDANPRIEVVKPVVLAPRVRVKGSGWD